VELFRTGEAQNLQKELEIMTKLWRWIIGLNNPSIIKLIFSQELYLDTFGIFECTPTS